MAENGRASVLLKSGVHSVIESVPQGDKARIKLNGREVWINATQNIGDSSSMGGKKRDARSGNRGVLRSTGIAGTAAKP